MLLINYPKNELRTKKERGKEVIFDEIRRKWIILTSEEWVRQNILQYLIKIMRYPASLIAVEKMVKLGELKKRCDIVVYKAEKPWMIVECKEIKISLNQLVLEQVINYNMAIPANYLVISNGIHHYGFERKDGKLIELSKFPLYN